MDSRCECASIETTSCPLIYSKGELELLDDSANACPENTNPPIKTARNRTTRFINFSERFTIKHPENLPLSMMSGFAVQQNVTKPNSHTYFDETSERSFR